MKIGFLNDLHLPEIRNTAQYHYFQKALEDIRTENPELVIVNGDITADGGESAAAFYLEAMKGIKNITVLGNSDVRSEGAVKILDKYTKSSFADIRLDRKILCINTPYAEIEQSDREKIDKLAEGDILVMHHSIPGLKEESSSYISEVLRQKSIVLIHAHSHDFKDYSLGKSRVICLRALDPDKSIGKPPCITYFEVTDTNMRYYERCFSIPKEKMQGFSDLLGISCFDIEETFDFAMRYPVKHIELRKYSQDDGLFELTCKKVKEWREKGGQTLSIHMPNLGYNNGIVDNGWKYAYELAMAVGVNSVTIHPPRVSVKKMQDNNSFIIDYYCRFIESLPPDVKVGFENLHMNAGAVPDETRQFGCIPEEQCFLIDRVNEHFGYERVGAILDVGHARNNSPFNEKYTLGVWYAMLGNRTVAYHIHQVKREEGKLKNHRELDEWFGPMISYSSFFHAWQTHQINHRPMFMEMRDLKQAIVSLKAFEEIQEF